MDSLVLPDLDPVVDGGAPGTRMNVPTTMSTSPSRDTCRGAPFSSVCRSNTPNFACSNQIRADSVLSSMSTPVASSAHVTISKSRSRSTACGPSDARHLGEHVLHEGGPAAILEPLDAVMGLRDGIVESVTLREEYVEVAVEVDGRHG